MREYEEANNTFKRDNSMQLYKAAYIYPVSFPAITDGIIAVENDHIAAIGPAAEVMQQYAGAPVTDLGEVMLLPQAVNAHTHLELTPLAELGKRYVADRSFVQWILQLLDIWRATPQEVQVEGAREGCRMLIESGTAVVADISNTHASLEPLLESGLYGVIYHELIGPDPAGASLLLQQAQEQVRRWQSEYGEERIRFGVTLHTPFTVSAELFRLTAAWVIEENVPLCIHIAESPAETEFLLFGTGEIPDSLFPPSDPLREWIRPPGLSPVRYLDNLGVLATRPLLAHGVQVNAEDLRLLAEYRATVAHCPRSNFLLNCGLLPIEAYLAAGAPLAMGTDSLGSSPSLSVWEEAVTAARLHREAGEKLDPYDLLRLCTLDGARALGFDDILGSLEVGKLARLVVGRMMETGEGGVEESRTAGEMLRLLWEGEVDVRVQ
jgi:cytosine/adenosine deaminase-related metal-dependent hydrolase